MGKSSQSKRVILVVDDSDDVRLIISRILTRHGHEVIEAVNGKTAIELIRHHHFDVIITDVRMAGTGGVEVVAAAEEIQPGARRIVMTGIDYLLPEIPVETAVRFGADGALRKPFTVYQLITTLGPMFAGAGNEGFKEP